MKDIWRGLENVIQRYPAKLAAAGILFLICITRTTAQPYVMAKHLTYDVIYDYGRMSPAVILYELDEKDFRGSISSKPKYFKQDRLLPPPRVKNEDFRFSGYERGHLCPAGDRDARKDWFKDTFYTSNIVPMTGVCNSGAWKEVELSCRKSAVNGHPLRIVCGPIWYQSSAVSNTIPGKQIPPTLYKIAVCKVHPNESTAWIIHNNNVYKSSHKSQVPVDSVWVALPETLSNYIKLWIKR